MKILVSATELHTITIEMSIEELERLNDVLNFLNIPRDAYEIVASGDMGEQQIAIQPLMFLEMLLKIAEFQVEIAKSGASEMMAAMERTKH